MNVYRSVGSATNYVYCSPSGNRGRGRCRGIGFGGDLKCPRLFIGDSDDSVCVASSFDKTYESGELLDDGWKIGERFRVEHLEVWAVGGEDAIEAGLKSRDMKRDVCEANIIKARTVVDKAGFLNDFTSGLIESKVWAHRAQARGRASYRADENHGGYTLDSSTGTKQQRL